MKETLIACAVVSMFGLLLAYVADREADRKRDVEDIKSYLRLLLKTRRGV